MAKSADAFRTISEVAEWLGTPAHVLRFWESKFTQVKPVKRAGGRRYYRPNDMLLLGGIKKLLHEDGMTIKGVQKLLRTDGVQKISTLSHPIDGEDSVVIDMVTQEPISNDTAPAPDILGSPSTSSEPEIKPQADPELTEKQDAPPTPDTQPEIEPQATPERQPDPTPELDVQPTLDVRPEIEPQAMPEPQPDPTPELDVQPAREAEPDLAPKPAVMLEPDPASQPAPALDPAPAPVSPAQSDTSPPTATEASVIIEPINAGEPTEAPKDDAKIEQLSAVYSRLSALHERMKANIDPKRQG